MLKLVIFSAAVLLPIVTACSTPPARVSEEPRLTQADTRGLALMSVTVSDGELETFDQFALQFRRVDSDRVLEVFVVHPGQRIQPNIRGDKTGRVLSLPLAPGEYRLIGWRGTQANRHGGSRFSPEFGENAPHFIVAMGRMSYVGNVNFRILRYRQIGFELRDNAAGDLAVLRTAYGIDPHEVKVELMQ